MKSGPENLDGRQATLLLYISDQLPEADREEVRRRIAEDASVRQEMEALQAAQASIWTALAEMDRQTRPAVPDSVANRRVGHLIRNWVKERSEIPAPIPMPRQRAPIPWTRYAAAAALLLVTYMLWPRVHLVTPPTPETQKLAQMDANLANSEIPMGELSSDQQVAMLKASFADDSDFADANAGVRLAVLSDTSNDVTGNNQ